MIKELIKLSTHLDGKGYHKEADYLDAVIKKHAQAAGSLLTDVAKGIGAVVPLSGAGVAGGIGTMVEGALPKWLRKETEMKNYLNMATIWSAHKDNLLKIKDTQGEQAAVARAKELHGNMRAES